jgi:hypothetical protein
MVTGGGKRTMVLPAELLDSNGERGAQYNLFVKFRAQQG